MIELASASDDVNILRRKMTQYQDNGVHVGWLIIPKQRQVEVFQQNVTVEVLSAPRQLSVGSLMPGFVCDMTSLF